VTAISEPSGEFAERVDATEPAPGEPASNGHGPADALPRALMNPELTPALSVPADFGFDAVHAMPDAAPVAPPPLGPLAAFTGNWTGGGLNTIFRPDNPHTPTVLPVPVTGSDNILELNLTQETLSFSKSLGTVPNRGSVQGDAKLNGVPYLQTINDITSGRPVGIHFEPGMWVIVPPTQDPAEGSTLVRMASIPHGTTINAQGTFRTFNGPPTIHKVDITPFIEGQPDTPPNQIRFASQTATNHGTPRIPQDLTPFIANGKITQAILDDPNTVLRQHNAGLHITKTTAISISTAPSLPLFGGGTDNIAFLWGDAAAVTSAHPSGQNGQSALMTATFWIETVQHTLLVPDFKPGQKPFVLKPTDAKPGQPAPRFNVRPPFAITHPRLITVTSTQIQYSQLVILNFAGLSWPHVSVSTLVPASPQPVPASAWV
jgi:hypothetical protein